MAFITIAQKYFDIFGARRHNIYSYMKYFPLRLDLSLTEEQSEKLIALQECFARACNALIPTVRETHCWNRVTLHHIGYRKLRDAFPELGSQMICNAIYSVSRTCRYVFQAPESPFFRSRRTNEPMPDIHFLPTSPVFFDRHTISIKNGMLSMFTLGGRMRFCVLLAPGDESRFEKEKLREIVLVRQNGGFQLNFIFGDPNDDHSSPDLPEFTLILPETASSASLPDYGTVLQVSGRTFPSLSS